MIGSSAGRAGSINVWACHQPNGAQAPLDGWDWNVTAAGIYPWNFCERADGYFGMGIYQEFHPQDSYGAWTFKAPANTTVKALKYWRGVGLAGSIRYGTFRGTSPGWLDDSVLETCQPSGCTSLQPAQLTFNLDDNRNGLLFYLQGCTQAGGCNEFTSGWVAISWAAVTLTDQRLPTFSQPTGPLTQDAPLHGIATLSVPLSDDGTGIYKIHGEVDGRTFDDHVIDGNGGKCQPIGNGRDFLYTVPCPLNASGSTSLDTTKLSDGQHEVRVSVEDAAGNVTTVFHDIVATQNEEAQKTQIRLRITPRRTSNMHAIHWRGRVIGGKLPRRGATVLAQVKQGRGWIVFRQIRTNAAGRFRFDYRFHATTVATTYAFRVALAHGSVVGQAKSKTIKVRVEP